MGTSVKKRLDMLELLLQKGFAYRIYKDEPIPYFAIEIVNKSILKEKAEQVYIGTDFDEEESHLLSDTKLIVEVAKDFSTMQWVFTGQLEEFERFTSLDDFKSYVETLPDKIV